MPNKLTSGTSESAYRFTQPTMKPQFEVALIDFSVKRLNLVHNPQVQSTIQGGRFNEIGEQIVRLRKSFIPKF